MLSTMLYPPLSSKGTFIAKLNRSFQPTQGGVLSFRGDMLLHGGDTLIEGTRYIIVAFCYSSTQMMSMTLSSSVNICPKRQNSNENEEENENEREKNKRSKPNTIKEAFTFSFKL